MDEENKIKHYRANFCLSLTSVMSPYEIFIMEYAASVWRNLPNDVRGFPISYCDLESTFRLSPTTIKKALHKFSKVSDYNGKELQLLKVTFKANGKPTYYEFLADNYKKLEEYSSGISKVVHRNFGKEYIKTTDEVISDIVGRAIVHSLRISCKKTKQDLNLNCLPVVHKDKAISGDMLSEINCKQDAKYKTSLIKRGIEKIKAKCIKTIRTDK